MRLSQDNPDDRNGNKYDGRNLRAPREIRRRRRRRLRPVKPVALLREKTTHHVIVRVHLVAAGVCWNKNMDLIMYRSTTRV